MTYYIEIINNKPQGKSENNNSRFYNENYYQIEVDEEIFNDYENINLYDFDIENKTFVKKSDEEIESIKNQKEKERINSLTLTKRVFALALTQLGITYTQLKELISTDEQAQLEWDLCVELERSNPLLDIMASKLNVTPKQLDYIFQKANGEDVEYPEVKEVSEYDEEVKRKHKLGED